MQAVGLISCPIKIFHCSYFWLFICSFVPYRHHRLMVRKYGSKKKSQATKWQAANEGRLVWEMEWVMDVKLFLEGQAQWEEDSPHCLVMMHEMFQHAAAKGQKEAEQTVHRGCWEKFPQQNPVVQLVGPETSEEELQELYLEVYKLHRLPGYPPGETALLEEVVSSLKDHQGRKEERTSAPQQGPSQLTPNPQEAEPPGRERGTARWRGVWPPYKRPTKKHWPQWLPLRQKLKD